MIKLTTVAAALMLGVALPALAGPDFQALERARHANRTLHLADAGKSVSSDQAAERAQGTKNCDLRPLVLPLDHGPRAQTTPYLNEVRRQRFEAEVQACGKTPA